MNKAIPWIGALGAAGLGVLVALAGSAGGGRVAGIPVFALCVALAFAIQWLAFVPAYLAQSERYFGEILLWAGIAVAAWPALQGWALLTLVSPLFIVLLLTRISGVRMLEASGRRRWGENPDYQDYLARTPVLIPRRPKQRPASSA